MQSIRTIIIFLLMTFSCLASGQDKMSFSGIQFGKEYKYFIKDLKSLGFNIHLERDSEDDYFYGVCKECFLTGEIDDNPAVVHVTASHMTRVVFEAEVILREFIDQEEAVDEADRLLPQLRDEHPFRKTEVEIPGMSLIEMPGGKKRITKYLCYPVIGMRGRYYESQEKMDANDSFGSVSIKVYQNSLGHEHIVVLDYYDMAAGKLAEAESGKTH